MTNKILYKELFYTMDQQLVIQICNSSLTRNEKIAALIENGYSSRFIQQTIGCGPNIISTVRKSLNDSGEPPDQAKIGRPTKKTPEVKSFVIQQTISNPYVSGRDLSQQIQLSNDFDVKSVGKSTINSIRHDNHFQFLPSVKEPRLTEEQIQKRINFCYSYLLQRDNFPVIGFSDKSRFSLCSDKNWLWRQRGQHNEKAIQYKNKYEGSIMVWGMIAPNYKPEIFIFSEYENSKVYQDMLNEKNYLNDALTFFTGNFIFQQDGARTHTTPDSIDSISNVCDLIINWPPNSPDLNPIEMIWSLMDKTIGFFNPQNETELIDAIKYAWNAIKLDTINNLCNSFTRRCFLCLKNRGKCIQHELRKKIDYDVSQEEIDSLLEELQEDGIKFEEIEIILPKIE